MTETATASSLHIRPATEADIPRLVRMVNAAFSIETFLEGTRTDAESLAATMAKGKVLVAEDAEGQALGSIYVEVRGERGYMGMLAVDPARQGQGLGGLLVGKAEEILRHAGCQAVDICVLSLRPELLPLYRRFGFQESGTEEFNHGRSFREPVECHMVVMSKVL
jgi:predicted N-acetyltransferase YhbS